MKRLVLAALSLLLAGQALALDSFPTSRLPRSRRIAVVRDDGIFGVGVATQNQNKKALDRAAGGLFEAYERQGCQIDYLNTGWFLKSSNMTNSEATLWKNIGNTYALVFVYQAVALGTKAAGAANTTRFYRADSTNAQLFLLYGARSKEMLGGDSTFSHVVAATGGPSRWVAYGGGDRTDGLRIAYRPYGTTDTLWLPLHEIAPCAVSFASGITSVVRSLEPLPLMGTLSPIVDNADSTLLKFPDLGDSTASSTHAANGYEILGPVWRTYFSNGRWVENFSAQFASPLYTRNYAMLAYAIGAKYVDVDPIKYGVEMDDVFDMVTAGDSTIGVPKRWTNAGYDSLYTRWTSRYGCKPAVSVNPLHGYEYMRGIDPTWETSNAFSHKLDAPWVGAPWTWPRKFGVGWVYHSHDSSAARISSNLVGRYGGYQGAGNGLTTSIGGQIIYAYHRQRGFAWAPGQTEHEGRYGIYQKLLYSDSLRRIVCPECVLPPYLSFPNNEVLPVNWRERVVNSAWHPYRSRYHGLVTASLTAYDSLCTVDSTFLAMARGLRIPSGGTLYIRGTVHDGVGSVTTAWGGAGWRVWGSNSPKIGYTGAEGKVAAVDSVIAWTPFIYPGETRTVRDTHDTTNVAHVFGDGKSYWITVKNIGALPFDATASTVQTMRGLSPRALSRLLGFWTGVLDGSAQGPIDSTSTVVNGDYLNTPGAQPAHLKDPTGVYGTGTEQRGYTRDRPRVIYFHPVNYTGSTGAVPTGPGRNSQTDNFEQQILVPIKALNTLAGKTIIKCVQPWEVYDK